MSAAAALLERLRAALDDPDDPEHQTTQEAVEAVKHRGPVARFVEATATVQDPTSALGIDELGAAARRAGVTLDDVDLALATLFLESGSSRQPTTLERLRDDPEAVAVVKESIERDRIEALRGPNRIGFDPA